MDQRISDEEQANLITKLFNCTETPIKEWISKFINEDVSYVFSDYVDDSDVIGFQENDKHYNAYVVTLDNNTDKQIDDNLLKNSEKTRKACSMLYDGVYQVFAAVIQTCSEEFHGKLKSLRPIFDEKTMSFKLLRINGKASQLQLAIEQKEKISKMLSNPNLTLNDDQYNSISNAINNFNSIITTVTPDILNIEELECKEVNVKLNNYDKLYIVVEESDDVDADNIETSLRRLPVFGLSYQDPDEENYIDKLKKEYDLNE